MQIYITLDIFYACEIPSLIFLHHSVKSNKEDMVILFWLILLLMYIDHVSLNIICCYKAFC